MPLNGHELPIDRAAAMSYANGEPAYKPDTGSARIFNAPPEMKKFCGPPEFDLIGKKFGRVTVIGQYCVKKENETAKWVVRCCCGNYTLKSRRQLLRSSDVVRCHECVVFADKKRHYEFIEYGYNRGPNGDY